MFKASITIAALTSSVSASSSNDLKSFNKMTMKKSKSHFTVSTDKSSIRSAAAVSGTWVTTQFSDSSCTFTASNTDTTNTKMGTCIPDGVDETTLQPIYTIYTCTQDGSMATQTYKEYTDDACKNPSGGEGTVTASSTCTEDTTDGGFFAATCSNSPNNGFVGQAASYSYTTQASCSSGTNYFRSSGLSTGCTDDGEGGSQTLSCAGFTSYDTVDCTGTSTTLSLSAAAAFNCFSADDIDGTYQSISCIEESEEDDVCFHVESKINYKGVEYTYEELKAGKEPECTVPHSPSSKGVIVSTSCGKTVRVTDTHLLATTKGFQLAYSLKAGDVLFGDYDKELCTVKSVEKEKTAQQYFGLNCVHSEVLASGIRASTFGDFHTLPSWYMTYVGGLVGTETASSLGEYVAEWYFKK